MTHIKKFKTLSAFLILSVFFTMSTGAFAEEGNTTDTITKSAPVAGDDLDTGKIDINTANQEQLISLPGIGPSLADRILKHRSEIGKFQKKEDIVSVKGIGQKKYDKISGMIIIR